MKKRKKKEKKRKEKGKGRITAGFVQDHHPSAGEDLGKNGISSQ